MFRIFVILLIMSLPATVKADLYFGGGYGVGFFNSEVLEQAQVSSTGPSYGGYVGLKQQFLGLECFYYNASTKGETIHNKNTYDISTVDNFYGAALRFHLNFINMRVGYGYHSFKQTFEQDGEPYYGSVAMNKYYDLASEKRMSEGLVLGAGLLIPINKYSAFYADVATFAMTNINAEMVTVQAGIRFDMPYSIAGK